MDKFSLPLSELTFRISSIQNDIKIEEEKYNTAVSQNLPEENLQDIKERISFLKRKSALYTQAKQMRKESFN